MGIFISGIDKVFSYQNTGLFVIIGLICVGSGTAYVTIPVMPEILTGLEEHVAKKGIKVNQKLLFNSVSGYFIFF